MVAGGAGGFACVLRLRPAPQKIMRHHSCLTLLSPLLACAIPAAANPQLKLHVVGHTGNQGTADHNLDLSRRRAATVVRELGASHGVAPGRLDAFGCGLYAPVASNDSEEGRAKNRRVELVKW